MMDQELKKRTLKKKNGGKSIAERRGLGSHRKSAKTDEAVEEEDEEDGEGGEGQGEGQEGAEGEGYYDEDGNWVATGYYDEEGNLVEYAQGYYDEQGNWVPVAAQEVVYEDGVKPGEAAAGAGGDAISHAVLHNPHDGASDSMEA